MKSVALLVYVVCAACSAESSEGGEFVSSAQTVDPDTCLIDVEVSPARVLSGPFGSLLKACEKLLKVFDDWLSNPSNGFSEYRLSFQSNSGAITFRIQANSNQSIRPFWTGTYDQESGKARLGWGFSGQTNDVCTAQLLKTLSQSPSPFLSLETFAALQKLSMSAGQFVSESSNTCSGYEERFPVPPASSGGEAPAESDPSKPSSPLKPLPPTEPI